MATHCWLTLKLSWLVANGLLSNLWEKEHPPSHVISEVAPCPLCSSETTESCVAQVPRAGHDRHWPRLSIGGSLRREGDHHGPARYAQLSMSAWWRGSCCFMWMMQYCTQFWVVLFCTFQFSVERLNFPSNCGDDYGHLLANYACKAIERTSLLILGDSHFKTMKQFFLSWMSSSSINLLPLRLSHPQVMSLSVRKSLKITVKCKASEPLAVQRAGPGARAENLGQRDVQVHQGLLPVENN